MKLLTTTKLRKKDGKYRLKVELWSTSRGGTLSPISFYLKYKGKWQGPKAQEMYWEPITLTILMNWLFKHSYSDHIKDLIKKENPLLKLIPKDYTGVGYGNYPIPIKYTQK